MAFFENKIVAFSILIILFTVIGEEGTRGAPCIIEPQTVVKGGRATITCSFPSVSRKKYIHIKFTPNLTSEEENVVRCDFEKGSMDCRSRPNYRVDQTTINKTLTLILPQVSLHQSGVYFFQQNQQQSFYCTCNLTVTDIIPTTTTTTTRKPATAPSTTTIETREENEGISSQDPLMNSGAVANIISTIILFCLLVVICISKRDKMKQLCGNQQGNTQEGRGVQGNTQGGQDVQGNTQGDQGVQGNTQGGQGVQDKDEEETEERVSAPLLDASSSGQQSHP